MRSKKLLKGIITSTLLALTCAIGIEVKGHLNTVVNAEEKTVTWTATSGSLGGTSIGTGTIKTGDFEWSYTRTLKSGESYSGWTSNCVQLGKKGGVENVTFSTSNILGTIKSVSIECSSYNNAHKVEISVGGNIYLNSTNTAKWTDVSTLTGTGKSSGTITINVEEGTRAFYIKSISVTYDDSVTETNVLKSIYASSTQIQVYQGKKIDESQITVIGKYDDGTEKELSSGWTVTCDTSIVGNSIVATVSYGDFTTTFNVKVVAEPTTSISNITSQGSSYRIKGKVVGRSGQKDYVVQDSSRGVLVQGFSSDDDIKIGDTIAVTGTYTAQKYGDIALTIEPSTANIIKDNENPVVINPITSYANVTSNNYGHYVELKNLVLNSSYISGSDSTNLYLKDIDSFYLRTPAKSFIECEGTYSVDDHIDITGFIQKYNDKVQIIINTMKLSQKHLVTVNTGYGAWNVDAFQIWDGSKIDLINAPNRFGYNFDGFYSDEAYNNKYDFNSIVTSNITLYGKWISVAVDDYSDAIEGLSIKTKLSYNYSYHYSVSNENKSTTASIDLANQGYTNQQEISGVTVDDNVSLLFNKGTNTNSPKYYTSGASVRLYGGGTLTISSTNYDISEISFTFGSGENNNEITSSVGSYKDGSWTGSSKSITFTVDGTSGNRRFASVTITYSVEEETTSYDSYQFTSGQLRLGTIVDKNVWNSMIATEDFEFGLILTDDSDDITAYLTDESFLEEYENDVDAIIQKLEFVKVPGTVEKVANCNFDGSQNDNGEYIMYNAVINVTSDDIQNKYSVTCYFVINNQYYFLDTLTTSVYDAASNYLKLIENEKITDDIDHHLSNSLKSICNKE